MALGITINPIIKSEKLITVSNEITDPKIISAMNTTLNGSMDFLPNINISADSP